MTVMGLCFLIEGVMVDSYWLIWLGVEYPGFSSVDYTPIIPWFGVILLGISAGHVLVPQKGLLVRLPKPWKASSPVGVLTFLGRRSLIIYLLHQPLLFGCLYLMRFQFGII